MSSYKPTKNGEMQESDAKPNGGIFFRLIRPTQGKTYMTTSRSKYFLSEILDGEQIPLDKLAYFRERLRNRIYDLVVSEFQARELSEGLSQAKVGRRIGKGADQVNRWLGSPGNWTSDTVSDLLLGIAAGELDLKISSLANRARRNFIAPPWVKTITLPAYAGGDDTSTSSAAKVKEISLAGVANGGREAEDQTGSSGSVR